MVEKLKIDAIRYVFEFIHYNNGPLPPDDGVLPMPTVTTTTAGVMTMITRALPQRQCLE